MEFLIKNRRRRAAIVAYDISDDRLRRKALRLVRGWRSDGQLWVHECLLTPNEANELFLQLGELIDVNTDRIMLAWLDTYRPVRTGGAVKRQQIFPLVRQF